MMQGLRRKIRDSTPYFIVSGLLSLFVVAYLFHRIFITVPAGHGGVIYKWFDGGTQINTVYDEGLHVLWPWNSMTIYSLRIQIVESEVDVLTADGLSVKTTLLIRFRPTRRMISLIHKDHGPNYVDSYLLQELESSARHEIGQVTPAEFYSAARDSVEATIDLHLRSELREVDEFLNTEWPYPPGFEDWLQATGEPQNGERIAYNARRATVFDSLNVVFLLDHLGNPDMRLQIEEEGFLNYYHDLTMRRDSLMDDQHSIDTQRRGIEGVLVDDSSELDTGLFHIPRPGNSTRASIVVSSGSPGRLQEEVSDEVLVRRYDDLRIRKMALETQIEKILGIIRELESAFDRSFMGIEVHDVLIKNIALPKQIEKAIQNKLEQEQIAEEFKFRLIREQRESERKRIEAEGIRDFQEIVVEGITPGLLRWKGIEATLELARSSNSKVVIVGSGDGGLPLILNTGDMLDGETTNTGSVVSP